MSTIAKILYDGRGVAPWTGEGEFPPHRETWWNDINTGAETHGQLDPRMDDWPSRVGNPEGLRVKTWPEKIGGEGTGILNQVTVELARKMLGADPDDNHDAADLNFIRGAGPLVAKLAGIKSGEPFVPATPAPQNGVGNLADALDQIIRDARSIIAKAKELRG